MDSFEIRSKIWHEFSGRKLRTKRDFEKVVDMFDSLAIIDYGKLLETGNGVIYEYHISYYFDVLKQYSDTEVQDGYVHNKWGIATMLWKYRKAFNDAFTNPNSEYDISIGYPEEDIPHFDIEGNRIIRMEESA